MRTHPRFLVSRTAQHARVWEALPMGKLSTGKNPVLTARSPLSFGVFPEARFFFFPEGRGFPREAFFPTKKLAKVISPLQEARGRIKVWPPGIEPGTL